MVETIHGASGPYWLDIPGGYGRNAAFNAAQELAQVQDWDSLKRLTQKTMRYTPEETIIRMPQGKMTCTDAFYSNVFAHLETSFEPYDKDRSGDLDLEEYQSIILEPLQRLWQKCGNSEVATSLFRSLRLSTAKFKTLDKNEDGKVDVVESAADVIFQDNAPRLLADKLIHPEEIAQAEALRQCPSEFDGQITDPERGISLDIGYGDYPNLVGEILDAISQEHDLRNRYSRLKLNLNDAQGSSLNTMA